MVVFEVAEVEEHGLGSSHLIKILNLYHLKNMKKPLKLNIFINKTILTITKNLYQFFDHKITFVNTNLALYQKIQILCS